MSRELPIFPLPLVLFPGTTQPLHIFEPRYRGLLADCLAGDRRFGIAFVAPAPQTDPEPQSGDVGCIARITQEQMLPDGRSNVLTVGERRFTLLEWVPSERPYRMARVEEFDDEPEEAAEAEEIAAGVRDDFRRLSRALAALTDRDDEDRELPGDPYGLSFRVAAALELDLDVKQALLVGRSTTGRLRRLAGLLAPLSADAERRAVVRQRARGNGKGGVHPPPQIEPV
jgi:ATP-dependent Lon protease